MCPHPQGRSGAIKKECKPGVDLGNAMPPPTDRKPGSHSSLMDLPKSSRNPYRQLAKRNPSAPFIGFAPLKALAFYLCGPRNGLSSRLQEFSCCTAPFLSPLMKTSCSDCARREVCEMAAHPHPGARAATGSLAPARSDLGAKLLNAARWALALLGIFCLIGVVAVIATTPEAWPL